MNSRFGVLTVAPDFLITAEIVHAITDGYVDALQTLGGAPLTETQLDHPAPLFMLIATGGTENVVLKLHEARQQHVPDEPVFLIAHPSHNSVPAALEVLGRLQQDGATGRIFYLQGPDDEAGLQQIIAAVHDLAVHEQLQQARIGLVGDPSDWLVASMPGAAAVKKSWGPEVVPVPMAELEARLAGIEVDDAVTALVAELQQAASETREPSNAELVEVVRVYKALRKVVDDRALDALTLRCFDLVLNLKTTGCFGLAQLTDEGIIAGCEGDLVSTVGLLWAYKLLDKIPWMANPAQFDETENAFWLAHCTVPRRIVESYRLRSHFESSLGVGIQGILPSGPVTLLRIGGKEMRALWLAEGELLEAGEAENLCRTQARVQLSLGHVTDLLHAPLGNHLVLVPGHHADRLLAWWETFVK
ncbi:MAG: hypothetical protein JXB35_13000 [Anaerolineae bacterium]|nr:hypothetical protein [Anaerolineae bacterium]